MTELPTITPQAARQWPDKVKPLTPQYERQAYPLNNLPEVIRQAVKEVQEYAQAPVPLIASCAVSAVSLATQGHIDIARDQQLRGPVSLFMLTLGDSGERKTTVDGYFTKAIVDYEKLARIDAEPEIKQYESTLKAHKAKCKGLLSKITQLLKEGKPTNSLEQEHEELCKQAPVKPKIPRLLITDATPEALLQRLNDWPAAGLFSDEGGTVFGGHGMGSESAMRYMALMNSLWGGSTQRVDRRTTESFMIENPRLSLHIQVQEPVLQEFLGRNGKLVRGSGLLARFLISEPESTQGTRMYRAPPSTTPALEAFNSQMAAMLTKSSPLNDDGVLEPVLLQLSPEAKQAWVEFHDDVEKSLGFGGEFADVRDVASKTADNAARLAALFHYFETQGDSAPVSERHMRNATAVAAWHLFESQRFIGSVAITPEQEEARMLNDWLIRYAKTHSVHHVSKRQIQQFGPTRLRITERRDMALDALVDAGRVSVETIDKVTTVVINPVLLGDS